MNPHPLVEFVAKRLYDEYARPDDATPSNRYCLLPEFVAEAQAQLAALSSVEQRPAVRALVNFALWVERQGFPKSAATIKSVAAAYPVLVREETASLLDADQSARRRAAKKLLGH